jgi:peptidoglycan/LPS O-acetylase OafA/YrhL
VNSILQISRTKLGRFIEDADIRHSGNIFNILRLVFASAVIYSHAFVLNGLVDPSEALLPFTVSRFAVLLFFTLSGFLVTNSLQVRGIRQFAKARALRMLPGLWVMLLVSAAVTTMIFGSLPISALPGNASLWQYLFTNGLFIGRHYGIDGVFEQNPLPLVINGALWTIPREVQCYVTLAIAAAFGLLPKRQRLLMIFILGIAIHLLLPPDLIPALSALRPLLISFFAGVILFLYRERVFLSWPLAGLAIALTVITDAGPLREVAAQLTAAYVTLVVAILVPTAWKRFSQALPDYSFGIYIYGFPVQQAMIATGIGVTAASNMATTFICTLPLAALSWHLIEKPALALKGRGGRVSSPAASTRAGSRR